jgi:hypothetical protein
MNSLQLYISQLQRLGELSGTYQFKPSSVEVEYDISKDVYIITTMFKMLQMGSGESKIKDVTVFQKGVNFYVTLNRVTNHLATLETHIDHEDLLTIFTTTIYGS